MKRIISVFLIVIVILLMVSCTPKNGDNMQQNDGTEITNEKYTIYKKDGQCYLQFTATYFEHLKALVQNKEKKSNATQSTTPDMTAQRSLEYFKSPHFSSVAEMQTSIMSGKISDNGLAYLYVKYGQIQTIPILNVFSLYDAVIPGDLKITDITWYGDSYRIDIEKVNEESNINLIGAMVVESVKEEYIKDFEENYTNLPDGWKDQNTTVIADNQNADNSERVILWENNICQGRENRYLLNTKFGSLYIREEYVTQYYNGDPALYPASDKIPKRIWIFGESNHNDAYFSSYFIYLQEKPSQRWFRTFALKQLKVT